MGHSSSSIVLWQAVLRLSHSNWSILYTMEFTSKAQRNFLQLNSKFSRCQFLPLRCRFHCCVPPTIRRWVPVSVLSVPLPETPFPSLLMRSCYHQPVKGALLLELYESLIYAAMGHNTWPPVKIKIARIYGSSSSKIWSTIVFDKDT